MKPRYLTRHLGEGIVISPLTHSPLTHTMIHMSDSRTPIAQIGRTRCISFGPSKREASPRYRRSSRSKGECGARMVANVCQLCNRLETTRARPGQPAEGVIQVASRGLHAFCAPPHTLLVLVPYISQSAVPVLQLLLVGSRTVYLGCELPCAASAHQPY